MAILKTFTLGLALLFTGAAALNAASLRATRGSQAVQNARADDDHLSRMENQEMVERWARLELLTRVPEKTSSYYLHAVQPQYRYLRPWAHLFLERLSSQYHARFKQPMRVTSLLRTASYQRSLQRRNGNAASATGPTRSAHLTGACMDISKKGMSGAQVAWVRNVLSSLRSKKFLYAVEEFQQPVFHILVHRDYLDHVDNVTSGD
ncbi:MAG: hypothetical protein GC160_21955 [Acidobacteria bacterium]|nr:hypothetical protein [Acidobacteriota bacterium]